MQKPYLAQALRALCVALLTATGRANAQPPAPEPDGPASRELRNLVKTDQADRAFALQRRSPTTNEFARMEQGDAKRLLRVHHLMQGDRLRTQQDFSNAALLFQHGTTTDDYQAAHELSFIANMRARHSADNLPALSEDRFLRHLGRKQRFGAQGRKQNTPGNQVEDTDEDGDLSVTDSLRADVFMPPLAALKEKGIWVVVDYADTLITRLKPRFDPKWQAEQLQRPDSQALAQMASAPTPNADAVKRTLALYRADELRAPADYLHAAQILFAAASTTSATEADRETNTRRLLLAHELAMVAALRHYPGAPRLWAETWDAFLLSVGQPQRYGTRPAARAAAAKAVVAPSISVRRALGLKPNV